MKVIIIEIFIDCIFYFKTKIIPNKFQKWSIPNVFLSHSIPQGLQLKIRFEEQ